jgi:hypothetical protein
MCRRRFVGFQHPRGLLSLIVVFVAMVVHVHVPDLVAKWICRIVPLHRLLRRCE